MPKLPLPRLHQAAWLAVALLITAPSATLAEDGAATVYAPNPRLLVQGIPDVPQSLADRVGAYNDFRGHAFVDWHPSRREMLISHRKLGANTAQLYRLSSPLGEPEQLTEGADPVTRASYEPRQGRYIVFERSAGGSEEGQLYRLDGSGQPAQQLTPSEQRHELQTWLHRSSELIYSALPLDRTAKGGSRAEVNTSFWLLDPMKPEGRRKLAELPGGGWSLRSVSPDDKQAALIRYVSATEAELWLLDLRSGASRQLLPRPGSQDGPAFYAPAEFSRDGKQLWLTSDRFGEFLELARLTLANGDLRRVSSQIPWDISDVALSADGRRLAAIANVDGRRELRLFDALSLKELPRPALPAGSVTAAHFDAKGQQLALALNNARGPSQIVSLDPKGTLQTWTRPQVPAGIDVSQFGEQQIVRWRSFDGETISGLLSLPPARFAGKRPVIISIHGGPESQASVGFLGRNNYFLQELGIAIIQPNVRGSAGYGKRFLALDNGFKREDSVKDIDALLDWIATQPQLDASRVLVTGGSYGGYMTLAVSTHYADRIAGAIDVVGISHFVTFLQNTESYRRDLRRVEYGDEREPAMREFLERISPLSNAERIKKPLFVIQGKNDPRVPYTEAEQIVAKVRAGGTPVWYLRAENEGHGFQRKENQDYQFYATLLFLQQTLLQP
ncbi:prolyl oligopeptidase family serine peptidase [Paucibacter sp. APW11]|uniref:Prolyl oligopeptidase family serine peptidase n=1 Tax=Roseateles aquae TaxID=3077235 RepID=A0ABU3PBA1_9BURK|nr:prolyl oligopeptidase family serine peptidase [Paucibacter sp. APW11]MDT8999041.1 prolyl oligopeptidase family serine peptidase [Paucibacter sp. APW11]